VSGSHVQILKGSSKFSRRTNSPEASSPRPADELAIDVVRMILVLCKGPVCENIAHASLPELFCQHPLRDCLLNAGANHDLRALDQDSRTAHLRGLSAAIPRRKLRGLLAAKAHLAEKVELPGLILARWIGQKAPVLLRRKRIEVWAIRCLRWTRRGWLGRLHDGCIAIQRQSSPLKTNRFPEERIVTSPVASDLSSLIRRPVSRLPSSGLHGHRALPKHVRTPRGPPRVRRSDQWHAAGTRPQQIHWRASPGCGQRHRGRA
jgi:hypothetical protein